MKWEDKVRRVVPYVAGEQPQKKNVIKLNTNECPYPPSPMVRKAMEEMDYKALRLYPDPSVTGLEQELAAYHGLDRDRIFVGVGSDDVLAIAFMTFFNGTEPILFPDVTYSFYDVWAELYRIPYKTCRLTEDWHIRPEDYRQPNGGIVLANPNAPTGVEEPLSVVEEIVRANPDVVVIVDEAYVDFGAHSCLPLVEKYDNLLVVQTFSKSRALAGLRIGYAMGSSRLIGYMKDVKFSFNSYTMNAPAQKLGSCALQDEEYFRAVIDRIIRTREWTKEQLTGLGFCFPDSKANFIFASHSSAPACELFAALRKQDIYVRHWDKERISNHLRITIGTDDEMQALLACLKEYLGK